MQCIRNGALTQFSPTSINRDVYTPYRQAVCLPPPTAYLHIGLNIFQGSFRQTIPQLSVFPASNLLEHTFPPPREGAHSTFLSFCIFLLNKPKMFDFNSSMKEYAKHFLSTDPQGRKTVYISPSHSSKRSVYTVQYVLIPFGYKRNKKNTVYFFLYALSSLEYRGAYPIIAAHNFFRKFVSQFTGDMHFRVQMPNTYLF
jgi:hypothetical protein